MDKKEVGKNIQKARKERKKTQKELAELIGVATGTIQQYELGKRQPNLETLEKIANVLNTGIINLLGYNPYAKVVSNDLMSKLTIDEQIEFLLKLSRNSDIGHYDEDAFVKNLVSHAHPLQELPESLEAIKTLMNQSGYDLIKVDNTFYFSGNKGGYQMTTEELQDFQEKIIDFISFQCQQTERRNLIDRFKKSK